MVCTDNDTSLNVTIPVVMIPKSAGEQFKDSLDNGGRGYVSISYLVTVRLTHIDLVFCTLPLYWYGANLGFY